ncbi:MAG: permease [Planctomycetota bacterium]|jgi:uncharacterized membrane protein YraQ (UPF0718 family)
MPGSRYHDPLARDLWGHLALIPLILSVLALAVGPIAARAVQGRHGPFHLFDGLTLVAITGLCFFHVFPDAVATAGAVVLVSGVVGFLLPRLAERTLHQPHGRVHRIALGLAVTGLLAHAAIDGAALASSPTEEARSAATLDSEAGKGGHAAATEPEDHQGHDHAKSHSHGHGHGHGESGDALGVAILLHRIPMGLLLWVLLGARFGFVIAGLALVAMGGATVGGFAFARGVMTSLEVPVFAHFLALSAGGLLHVVLGHGEIGHEHEHVHGDACEDNAGLVFADEQDRKSAPLWSGVGAALGLVVLIAASGLPSLGEGTAGRFLVLYLESAPALLIGLLMAGLVHAFLPAGSLTWLQRGGRGRQAVKGVIVGLPLPVCSCGVVPLYRSLVLRGAPSSAALAFLVATPELGLDAVLLSIPLLGAPLAGVRIGVAFGVALLAGIIASRYAATRTEGHGQDPLAKASARTGGRLQTALYEGFVATVDSIGPWLLVGLLVAAVAAPLVDAAWLRDLPGPLEVLLFALIGLPGYVCATAATPLAAILIAGSVSPGAALAFLITGPATNVTTFGVLSRLHGRKLALIFGAVVIALSTMFGIGVNVLIPPSFLAHHLDLHQHGASPLQLAAAVLLTLILLASLLRLGPRRWLAELKGPSAHEHPEGENHDHDHDHGHDHGHPHDHGGHNHGGGGCC